MFGRKTKTQPPRSKASDGDRPQRATAKGSADAGKRRRTDSDEALDFGASLLRDVADTLIVNDFDAVGEEQEAFDRWALHLLIQTPPPDRAAPPAGERDFKGARQYARARLKAQQSRVTGTVDGLRDVIDTFAEQFSSTLRDDVRSDRMAHGALATLREAAHHDDTDALKSAALTAISQLSVALEDKRTNHRLFAASMAEKITPIRDEVDRARRKPNLDAETGLLDDKDFELAAKVGEEAMALFLESSVVIVVVVDDAAVPKDVGDALSRVFPRRRDFVGRLDRLTYAAIARDCDDVDRPRFMQRVRERVVGVVKVVAATTRDDDSPPALVRALESASDHSSPADAASAHSSPADSAREANARANVDAIRA